MPTSFLLCCRFNSSEMKKVTKMIHSKNQQREKGWCGCVTLENWWWAGWELHQLQEAIVAQRPCTHSHQHGDTAVGVEGKKGKKCASLTQRFLLPWVHVHASNSGILTSVQQPNTKQITSPRVEKAGEWKDELPLPYRTGAGLALTLIFPKSPLGKVLEPQLHLESQIWLNAGWRHLHIDWSRNLTWSLTLGSQDWRVTLSIH